MQPVKNPWEAPEGPRPLRRSAFAVFMVTEVLSTDGRMTLITSGETFIPLAGESGYSLLMLKMDPDASEADVQAAFNAVGGATLQRSRAGVPAAKFA